MPLLRTPGPVPPLVVLELTYRCPNRCRVCFHADKRGRTPSDMPLDLVTECLDKAKLEGVERIRLTGGEPLLYPHLDLVLQGVKDRGMELWLNSAASVSPSLPWQRIGSLVDDILLPLRDTEQLSVIDSVIGALRVVGNPRIRLGVVLLSEYLPRLAEFVAFAREHVTPLELYRVMSHAGYNSGSTKEELRQAIDLLDRLNSGVSAGNRARIANAIPFCLGPESRRIAQNSFGGRFDDGRSRLIIGPEGTIRPSYPMSLIVGNIRSDSLAKAWSHPDLVTLHASTSLPLRCRRCRQLRICMGGSRYEALHENGNRTGMDPLAGSEIS